MKATHIIFITAFILASCAGTVIEPEVPPGTGGYSTEVDEPETDEQELNETEQAPEFDGFALTFTEGDLVELSPEAIDPDGDAVTYTFTEPLDAQGTWQTQIGDEGSYHIKITASDGDLKATNNVLLIIERANRAPVIDCVERATLAEGERFYVGDYCTYFDEDEEEVVVYYGGWPGVSRYMTTYDDAGDHVLFITANDKIHIVKHELPITVLNTNRAPTFPDDFPNELVGEEGDIFTIDTTGVTDADGDTLSFTFSNPFGDNGVWKSSLEDAGTYDIDVVAHDGTNSVKHTIVVEVQLANTKPSLKHIPDITVNEGETITLPISASDREGDELRVTISGWMTSETYTTTYDDAGAYTVTVAVSDGVHTVSQIVDITVNNVNRPPAFVTVA